MTRVYFLRPYFLEVKGRGFIVVPGEYLDVEDQDAEMLEQYGYAYKDARLENETSIDRRTNKRARSVSGRPDGPKKLYANRRQR